MAFRWRANDGLLKVFFGSSLPPHQLKRKKKTSGPPTTKLSGPRHAGAYTLANSEEPDEMPHNVAFHQGLHCLIR